MVIFVNSVNSTGSGKPISQVTPIYQSCITDMTTQTQVYSLVTTVGITDMTTENLGLLLVN